MKCNFYLIIDFHLFPAKLPKQDFKMHIMAALLPRPTVRHCAHQQSPRLRVFFISGCCSSASPRYSKAKILLKMKTSPDSMALFTQITETLWLANLFLGNWLGSPLHSDSVKSEKMAEELQTSSFTQVKIQQGNL